MISGRAYNSLGGEEGEGGGRDNSSPGEPPRHHDEEDDVGGGTADSRIGEDEETSSALHVVTTNQHNHGSRRQSSVVALIDPSHFALPQRRGGGRRKSISSDSSRPRSIDGAPGGRQQKRHSCTSSNGRRPAAAAVIMNAYGGRRHQHPVEHLADRLGILQGTGGDEAVDRATTSNSSSKRSPSSTPLVTNALDNYRLLETRIRIGLLGKGDTCEARAACLLWRQQHQTVKDPPGAGDTIPTAAPHYRDALSWDNLASHVGTKASTLQALHSRITNYLLEPARPQIASARRSASEAARTGAGASGTSCASGTSKATSAVPSAPPASGRTTRSVQSDPRHVEAADRELWGALSIRLQCPGPVVQQAKALWSTLEHHVANLTNAHDRRGYQYDMTRYRTAYQASCLHHVLTHKNRSRSHHRNDAAAESSGAVKRKRGATTGNTHGDSDDDGTSVANHATSVGGDSSGPSIRSHDGSGSHHKMADFVLPNSFTYLELRQVSKQVAQFVEEIGRQPSAESGPPSTAPSALSNSNRGGVGRTGAPLRGRTNSMDRSAADSTHARTSECRFNAASMSSTKKRRFEDDDDDDDDAKGEGPRRLNTDEMIDGPSQDGRGSTPGTEDRNDISATPLKSSEWVDRWLQKLWKDALVVDRDDVDALESMADDVLRRFGLLSKECAERESTPSAATDDTHPDASEFTTVLLTQDFEADDASISSSV